MDQEWIIQLGLQDEFLDVAEAVDTLTVEMEQTTQPLLMLVLREEVLRRTRLLFAQSQSVTSIPRSELDKHARIKREKREEE